MNVPEHFEVLEGYCRCRLLGSGPLVEAANLVVGAIAFCRKQGHRRLLIDTTKWTGHPSPDTYERYMWAQAFAKASNAQVKLAMVLRPEMMDPEKFEVTVAANRGLKGNVFVSEMDASTWLLATNDSEKSR
jgi:hypothetical protein